uniref:Uncharacterized protein n=1 Tax=Eutreptiella gymnastica TaxID=73025 RepID=A0A7S4LC58_9EUGL
MVLHVARGGKRCVWGGYLSPSPPCEPPTSRTDRALTVSAFDMVATLAGGTGGDHSLLQNAMGPDYTLQQLAARTNAAIDNAASRAPWAPTSQAARHWHQDGHQRPKCPMIRLQE